MSLTSINIGVINTTFFYPIPTINSASFSSPTTIGFITIGSITGNFTSYVVGRTGGSQGTFTSTSQTGASYTDPTALTANIQYTYTITPYIGGIVGIPFNSIVNPNNGSTPGKIYTLASPATLALTYSGATSTTTSVSFTWIGTLNNFSTLSIQTSATAATGVLSTPAYNAATQTYTTGASYTANTQATLYAFAVNVDGIGSGVSAAQASVNTCTWASANTPSFSSTSGTGTTLACTGTFVNAYVTFSPTNGSPATGSLITGTNSISQAYSSVVSGTYTFNIYPVNSLSYPASATDTNFATNTVVIPVSSVITAASFSSPTALGQIVISSITGTFTSFTVSRTGGSQGEFTSATQTFTNSGSYTDPTALTANTQYTYTITPISGGSSGTVFTAITNPKTSTTAGTIYTLGSPATLSLAYAGATSTTTAVSFTWIGTLSNFATLSIQTSTAAATGVLSTPAYNAATQTYTTGASYSANQSVTLYVFAVNVDGIGSGVAAAQGSVSTCTWGSCNAPTFSSTTATGTTLACTGTFSKLLINYTGTAGSPASGTTIETANSISQAYTLSSSTAYNFSCFPVNALNYQSSNSASAGTTTSAAVSVLTGTYSSTTVTGYTTAYVFTGNGSFNLPSTKTAVVLVVGGGGGGGGTSTSMNEGCGGGGAGGLLFGSYSFTGGTTYSVTIGGGGSGGAVNTNGGPGGNTIIGSNLIIAPGGGFGSCTGNGGAGGSGGGTGRVGTAGAGGTGFTTGGLTQKGSNGVGIGTGSSGGGGGGANAAAVGGTGGAGYAWINGVTYGGGGGGGAWSPHTTGTNGGTGGGGKGGGSNGVTGTLRNGVSGTANTGGGGGGSGGRNTTGVGGSGGTGIFIIAYN